MAAVNCLLLIIGLFSVSQQQCRLKDDAKDLLSVDYWGVSTEDTNEAVYVDEIVVVMKDGRRYTSLLEEGCKKKGRQTVSVYSKRKSDTDWERPVSKRMSSKVDFEIINLNPCETYQLKITALDPEVTVGVFEVGPYYSRTFKQSYLVDAHNQHYQTYKLSSSRHISVTALQDTVTIDLYNVCAGTVAVRIYEGSDSGDGIEDMVNTDLGTKPNLSLTVEGLKSCTM